MKSLQKIGIAFFVNTVYIVHGVQENWPHAAYPLQPLKFQRLLIS